MVRVGWWSGRSVVVLGLAVAAALGGEAIAQVDRFGDPLPQGAASRIGTTRFVAHPSKLGARPHFGSDGAKLVVQFGKRVCVQDAQTGLTSRSVAGQLPAFVFDDGRVLATTTDNKAVALWPVSGGSAIFQLRCQTQLLAASPDGRLLASVEGDHITLWSLTTGQVGVELPIPAGASGFGDLGFSPSGKYLLATGVNEVWMWATTGGKAMRLGVPGEEGMRLATLSANRRFVVYLTAGAEAVISEIGKADNTRVLELGGRQPDQLALAADGEVLVAKFDDEVVCWKLADGSEIGTLRARRKAYQLCLAPAGDRVGLVTDGRLQLWALPSLRGLSAEVADVANPVALGFSEDGEKVSLVFAKAAPIMAEAKTGALGLRHVFGPGDGFVPYPSAHPAGLFLGFNPGTKKMELRDGGFVLLGSMAGLNAAPAEACVAADRASIAAQVSERSSATQAVELSVFNVRSGAVVRQIRSERKRLFRFALSVKGVLAVAGTDPTLELFKTDRDTLWQKINHKGQSAGFVTFSADGALLAGQVGQHVTVWDMAKLKTKQRFKAARGPVAFSADGKLLATCSGADKSVRLWDVESGKELASFQGHGERPVALAFSPDGKMLASGAATTLVWRVPGR